MPSRHRSRRVDHAVDRHRWDYGVFTFTHHPVVGVQRDGQDSGAEWPDAHAGWPAHRSERSAARHGGEPLTAACSPW